MNAVSTSNDIVKIYLSKKSNGSSLRDDKISNSINKEIFIEVPSIDLAEFINGLNLNYDDELWVKMDIEGEGYSLIEHLHNTGALKKLLKCLWIGIIQKYLMYHMNSIKNPQV